MRKTDDIKLYPNGFIVNLRRPDIYENYYGVEGYSWYLDEHGLDERINRHYTNVVQACTDWEYIKKYAPKCLDYGEKTLPYDVELNILFCMSTVDNPSVEISDELLSRFTFIGYDYAVAGGSFYSCVFSDLVARKFKEFEHIQTNQYGLIDTLDVMLDFVDRRNPIAKGNMMFEQGEQTIMKLFKYNGGV